MGGLSLDRWQVISALDRTLPLWAFVLCLVSGGIAATNPSMVEFDAEEAVNASQALALLAGHGGMEFLRLQYATFCGGCTVDAAMGAAVFYALDPSWLAWKMVAVVTFAGFSGAAVALIRRAHGLPAAVALTVLVTLPSKLWLALSLVALGNHQEAGLLGALGLLVLAVSRSVRGTLLAGLILGFSLFVGWSAAPAAAAAAVALILRRSTRRLVVLLGGVLMGLGPGLLIRIYISQNHPIREIYNRSTFIPGIRDAHENIVQLLTPGLPAALYGWGPDLGRWVGLMCGVMVVVAGVRATLRRSNVGALAALAMLAWVAAYVLVDFRLESIHWNYLGTPLGLRYAAPLLPLTALLLATEAGHLWRSGRILLAGVILAPAVVSGLHARERSFDLPEPLVAVSGLHATDPDLEREIFSERLYMEELLHCDSESPRHRDLHGWAIAWHGVRDALDGQPRRFERPADLGPPEGFSEEMWWRSLGSTLAAQAGPDPGVPSWHVLRLESWIVDAPTQLQPKIRQEFWWTWLRFYPTPYSVSLGDIESPALEWAQGRMDGRGSTSWFRPRPEAIEVAILHSVGVRRSISDAWLDGFGFGAGEHWGPSGLQFPLVQKTPALARGYRAGVRHRWSHH